MSPYRFIDILNFQEELHYFMAVLQEGYRHVLAGSFNVPHFSSRDFTLGGHRIPKGTQIFVNYGAIRRNSRYFEVRMVSLRGDPGGHLLPGQYSVEQKKVPTKVGEEISIMAGGLCFACPRLVGRRKAGSSNLDEFLCTTLYINLIPM